MNHIILIGFMGCGKSTIGKKLAANLALGFVDTDELIETQAHLSIAELFSEYGEAYFRGLETLAVRQLHACEERLVISVGGGLPVQPANREYLKELGTIIYLTAEVDTLQKRLQKDTSRPLLQGENLEAKIRSLKASREAVYEEMAEVRISTDEKEPDRIVEEIKSYV